MTGHGLLKLMRPAKPLTYRIDSLPEVPEVLSFLVAQAGLDRALGLLDVQHGIGLRHLLPRWRGLPRS